MEAKFRRGDGVKGPPLPKQELDIGFDLMGPPPESNDGNVYKLVGATQDGVGSATGLPDKKAATVLKGVGRIMHTIRTIYKKPTTVKIRFHTDIDKSFEGEVAAYCQDKEWLQTSTEGYDSNAAARVENRNQKIGGHRALLLSAHCDRGQAVLRGAVGCGYGPHGRWGELHGRSRTPVASREGRSRRH